MDMWHVFICGVYSGTGKVGQKIWTCNQWLMIGYRLGPTITFVLLLFYNIWS